MQVNLNIMSVKLIQTLQRAIQLEYNVCRINLTAILHIKNHNISCMMRLPLNIIIMRRVVNRKFLKKFLYIRWRVRDNIVTRNTFCYIIYIFIYVTNKNLLIIQ